LRRKRPTLNTERPTSNAKRAPLNSVFGVGRWTLGVCYGHWNVFTTTAGLPATTQFAGTLFVTTAPAATTTGGLSGLIAQQAGDAFAHEPFWRAQGRFETVPLCPDLLA